MKKNKYNIASIKLIHKIIKGGVKMKLCKEKFVDHTISFLNLSFT